MDSSIIPFLPEVYDHVLASYNERLLLVSALTVFLGLVALRAVPTGKIGGSGFVPLSLSIAYFWVAYGFFVRELSDYSWAAWIYAGLFAIQGLAFLIVGLAEQGMKFQPQSKTLSRLSVAICLYALLGHPLISLGRSSVFEDLSVVGLHPAPTLMFTFGILAMAGGAQRWSLFVAPLLAGILVTLLSKAMGHPADLAILPIALLSVIVMIANRNNTDQPMVEQKS